MPKYPISEEQKDRLDNTFTYHAPFGDQSERYIQIRNSARQLAEIFIENSPPSREQSLALTNLEQAVMWANAAIARNEKEEEPNDAAMG